MHRLPPLRSTRSLLLCGLLPSLLPLQAARAAETAPLTNTPASAPASPPPSWSLGLSMGYQQQVYRDTVGEVLPLPLVSYENRWVRLGVPSVDLKLLPPGPLALTLQLRYDGSGYAADDSPALTGMLDRVGGVWAGAAMQWRGRLGELGLEASGEAFGFSKGAQAKLSLAKEFRLGRLGIGPRLALTWMDANYVDFYYGVRAEEALVTRAAYTGRATTNTELGLRAGYGLTLSQVMFVDMSVTLLGQAIQDSPIVDASTVAGARLGYLYRF